MALKTCYGYICNDGVQFQMETQKISRRRPRFVDTAKLDHFTFLFCRGRQRNVQRFITHVHSYCFAHQTFLFGDVLIAVVVVVCLSSLISNLLVQTPVLSSVSFEAQHSFSTFDVARNDFLEDI